jgi:hypothetical protein
MALWELGNQPEPMAATPRRDIERLLYGVLEYRYRDSNPGYRRERALHDPAGSGQSPETLGF